MNKFQDMLESALEESLNAADYDVSEIDLEIALVDEIPELVESITESIAESVLANIKRDAPPKMQARWRHQQQFEERLRKHWQKPLDLLELFISIATEAGDGFNSEFRRDAVESGDAVFEALVRLHARACQVSSAILVLLRAGYADDAHARWRSLHEISVVSYIISQYGQELAEKYLLHETIQKYKLAQHHQRYAERINERPISQEEFDLLKEERDLLINRFGTPFKEDYGWASSVIRKDRPTIRDIEEHVELDHMRPYYSMASDNVHANSHGAYFRIGLNPDTEHVLLAGASNMGLADPGVSTAISLYQITTNLLTSRPNLDRLVVSRVLSMLMDEAGQAFSEAHHELERSAQLDASEDNR